LGPKGADGRLGTFTLNAIYSALTQTQAEPTKVDPTKVDPAKVDPTKVDPTQGQFKLIELKAGMIGNGFMQDEAEGKTYKVNKSTALPCGITEVEFTNKRATLEYGYYKPNEIKSGDPTQITFRRSGEGVKDPDPCKNFASFENFGYLDFSGDPNKFK